MDRLINQQGGCRQRRVASNGQWIDSLTWRDESSCYPANPHGL